MSESHPLGSNFKLANENDMQDQGDKLGRGKRGKSKLRDESEDNDFDNNNFPKSKFGGNFQK